MMRGPVGLASLGAFLSVALVAPFVHGSPRVAALIPQIRPTPAAELRDRFHDAVSRGLQGSAEVVNAVEVRTRLGNGNELMNCAGSSACVGKIAGILRVDGVVATDVVATGKRYFIRVSLLDPQGRELGRAEETCEICTLKEADDAAARAAAQLQISSLRVAPPPEPKAKPTPPPEPPKPEPRDEPVPKYETPPPTPPTTTTEPKVVEHDATPSNYDPKYKWAAIGTATFGAIGIIVGAPLVAIDGHPTCDKADGTHTCPRVYSTKGGGGTMIALGIASLAVSAGMFYLDYKERKKPSVRASLLVGQGAGMLSFDGKF